MVDYKKSNFEFYAYGSPDCSDLQTFKPPSDFFIAIEIEIKKKREQGIETFYFFLCNQGGFEKQPDSNELKFVEIVKEYSLQYLKELLDKKIISKLNELNDTEVFEYLNANFNNLENESAIMN